MVYIPWFAKNMPGSGRSGDEGVTRVLSFDDSYVDGIGFLCRFELVNIKPWMKNHIDSFNFAQRIYNDGFNLPKNSKKLGTCKRAENNL